jgi:hypothetical protein
LRVEGNSDSVIDKVVNEENLFQYKTQRAIIKSLGMIFRRLTVVDPFLLTILAGEDIERGRIVAFYAIWKTDRLFQEFMSEVVYDKFLTLQYLLQMTDFKAFFNGKAEQSLVVAGWSERTFKDMREAYRRILGDVGMLNRKTGEVRPLLLTKDIREYFEANGDKTFVSVVTGG